jgi:hypothetical protein
MVERCVILGVFAKDPRSRTVSVRSARSFANTLRMTRFHVERNSPAMASATLIPCSVNFTRRSFTSNKPALA